MTSETKTALDIRERGRTKDGQPLFLDRRLFMQFLAFGGAESSTLIAGPGRSRNARRAVRRR